MLELLSHFGHKAPDVHCSACTTSTAFGDSLSSSLSFQMSHALQHVSKSLNFLCLQLILLWIPLYIVEIIDFYNFQSHC